MKHYDENTIELYTLGSQEIESIKDEIKNHLAECYGCNESYMQIKEFYSAVDGVERVEGQSSRAISTKSIIIKPTFGENKTKANLVPKTVIGKTYYLIRTNPVKSGLSLVAAIAIFLFGLNYKTIIKDTNPSYVITNDSLKVLQIYNHSNEELFELPFIHVGAGVHENNYNVKLTIVDDILNNNKNQIISIVPGLMSGEFYTDTIKILDNQGHLINKTKIGRSLVYNGKELTDKFNAFALIVEDFDKDGNKEIYVGAQNYSSPYVLIKFDTNLNILGEYWHYGHFWGMNKVTLGNKTGILLCGLNDIESGKEYPVLSFIDPTKLNGIYQSKNTPVFNDLSYFTEINYKKIPRTWISDSIKQKPRIHSLISSDVNGPKVSYGFASLSNSFKYGKLIIHLNNNLDIIDVIGDDTFERVNNNIPDEIIRSVLEKF